MRKYLPILISFLSILVVCLLWDIIKLPYNESNLIIGEYYYKKLSPQNDLLRFLFFILIPCFVYLISYLKINQFSYKISLNHKDHFLSNSKDKIKENSLNYYFFFFITLILIEFFSIDFQRFLNIDTYHDAVFLTPPTNYLNNKDFFQSSLYDYGFTGNNLGLIFNYLFGFYTLGAINFIKLILIFTIKIFLILISKQITEYLNYEIFFKKIFFIIFTFALISLPSYYDSNSYFSPRSALYLFFISLLGSALCENKYKEFKYFIIGSLSLASLLWWFDIGFYINFLLFLLSIYLVLYSEKKNLLFLLLGIFFSWIIFLYVSPSDEISAFIYNLKFILLTTDYLIGQEYLKPFSPNSGRWTKALFIIYISALVLINLNFSKKINLNKNLKIFLNLIFISGVVMFKSALTRSDSYHLKYTAGLYTLVFIFVILYFIFFYVKKNKLFLKFLDKLKISYKKKFTLIFFTTISLLFFSGVFNNKDKVSFMEKIINLSNSKMNIKRFIETSDNYYLRIVSVNRSVENLLVYEKYKKLSKNDACVQFFSDDNFFPYFLKKPTCTKFYLSNQIIRGVSEKEFISELKQSLPNIILMKSPNIILLNYDNFPNAIKYVKNKYEFYESYKGYVFYIRKNLN